MPCAIVAVVVWVGVVVGAVVFGAVAEDVGDDDCLVVVV